MQNQSHNKTKLQQAVEQRLRAPSAGSKQDTARQAGVSNRTLQQVLDGTYATRPRPRINRAKQFRGYTEAITRLAVYLGVKAEEAVAEYGIDLNWPGVNSSIEQVRARSLIHGGVPDAVLDAIAARKHIEPGILLWEPFVECLDQSTPDKCAEGSWAWSRYIRQLLGTINPTWVPEEPQGIITIENAIKTVLSPQNKCDFVFGIYDTVYRRISGVSFVHLPGVGIPLAAIYPQEYPINWADISGDNHSKSLRALVIKEEVGHLFLSGTCDFKERKRNRDLVVLNEGHTPELVGLFLRNLVEAGADSPATIFVADKLTCAQILDELDRINSDWLEKRRIRDSRQQESYQNAACSVRLLEPDNLTPVYPVGFAVRADARRWEEVLKVATQELFRNATEILAIAYSDLLVNHRGLSLLKPLPLEPYVPSFYARKFARSVIEKCGELAKGRGVKFEPKEWSETWLAEVGNRFDTSGSAAARQ